MCLRKSVFQEQTLIKSVDAQSINSFDLKREFWQHLIKSFIDPIYLYVYYFKEDFDKYNIYQEPIIRQD